MKILNIICGVIILYIALLVLFVIAPFDRALRRPLLECAESLDVIGTVKDLLGVK